MKVLISKKDLQDWRKKLKGSVVLVPTMGALHEGHLSLFEKAKSYGDIVVGSIYVNPKQFGPQEDLDSYPRTLQEDKQKLKKLGVDALYLPSTQDMYPDGFQTRIENEEISKYLCGITRPHHFSGVQTVVLKLFNQVRPQVAVFGQKDFQQVKIIERMVLDLDLSIQIKAEPIVRDTDGLALSSRNVYLNKKQRQTALILSRTLAEVQGRFSQENFSNLIEKLQATPMLRLQYAELRNMDLSPIVDVSGFFNHKKNCVLLLACVILRDPEDLQSQEVRLIDNAVIGKESL